MSIASSTSTKKPGPPGEVSPVRSGLAQLSPRQLRYVCEAGRLGSISAASEFLGIAQSSILAAIDLAESLLKMRLFERKQARGVRLTPVGDRFVKAALLVLSAQSEFVRAMGEIGSSAPRTLRIGCFEPFGALFMAEFLAGLRSRRQEDEVVLMEGDQRQLRQWIAEGAVDAAVAYDIGPKMGDGVSRICMVPPHVLLNASDPLASRKVVSMEDLAKRPLVLLDLPETSTYLLTLFEAFAARPHVSFRTRSYETLRAAVSAGFGVAVLNMRPVGLATLDGKTLVRRPIKEALPAPVLVVADIYGNGKPPYLVHLIESLRDYFRSRPVEDFAVVTRSNAKLVFDV